MSVGQDTVQEVAFYYPGHLWGSPEWIKSLLLFFDGIALLVPEYKQHEPEVVDPVLAGPLRDKGLLHYLIADQTVDKVATGLLAKTMNELLVAGAFDSLTKEGTSFHEISMSRMGFYGDAGIAEDLFRQLSSRGLARKSNDGVSIPLHPLIRYLILTLLAQILRPKGTPLGLDLAPTTDRFEIVAALSEVLNIPTLPSAGRVVAFDLQTVSVDLSAVPLDEVLSFRTQYAKEHRNYVLSIRKFAREISLMAEADREGAFRDRQEELDALANDLKTRARRAWRRPASFGLGLAGGFWTLASGNPIGALLSLGGLLTRGFEKSGNEAGAYSYIFSANKRFA
jgi:hypothetical protein